MCAMSKVNKRVRDSLGFGSKKYPATTSENSYQKAMGLIKEGKLEEAELIYRKQISEGSKNHITYGNLAAICGRTGRVEERLILLKKALAINSDYPEGHHNLGVGLKERGDIDEAINSFRKAIDILPNVAEFHNSLGLALIDKSDYELAKTSFLTAIRLKPGFADAHSNLGICLREKGEIDAAIDSYKIAIDLAPNYAIAHNNLGVSLREKGEIIESIKCFEKSLILSPNYLDAHTNLSHALLLTHNYKKGWEEYEYRSLNPKNASTPHSCPKGKKWGGELLSTQQKLLIVSEQGLGDTLQFMRYIPYLKNQGFDIKFSAQTKLHRLISESNIDNKPLTAEQANNNSNRVWMPLLSLPKCLEITNTKPIITKPYIFTKDELVTKWFDILKSEEKPIIGINWQGNPQVEKKGFRGRSFPLETFQQVVKENKVKLISLQKGFGSEQLKTCTFKDAFVESQEEINMIWDFLEIAAIIANCDLVITSDTVVAHLSGGMGKETWLLLNFLPDWRWGLKEETSCWYPSIRLFRQPTKGDWKKPIKEVSNELKNFLC